MRDLLRHEGQEVATAPVLDTSRWGLPKRLRGESYGAVVGKGGLRNGFAGLLNGDLRDTFAGAPDPDVAVRRAVMNVGDLSRRHFVEKQSEERPWKPGFKATHPEIIPTRPRGKKHVPFDTVVGNDASQPTTMQTMTPPSSGTNTMEGKSAGYRQREPNTELSDLPRGRRHVKPSTISTNNINGDRIYGGGEGAVTVDTSTALPSSRDAGVPVGEAALFKPKKVVVDPKSGIPRSWQGPPFFDTAKLEEDQRLLEMERKRQLREQLAAGTLIGGHVARTQQQLRRVNEMPPLQDNHSTGKKAGASIDRLGAAGSAKILAPSTAGSSSRRGDVSGLVLGGGGSARGGCGGGRGPTDLYAHKEAKGAIARAIAEVKALPSY